MDPSSSSSRDLYAQILGLTPPWIVSDVALNREERSVSITVTTADRTPLACPRCGKTTPGYDHQPRRWRHLDTCQFTTWILCDVPRVACPKHGVPGARRAPGSRTVGRSQKPLHAPVRGAGHRLAARGADL